MSMNQENKEEHESSTTGDSVIHKPFKSEDWV